MLDMILASNLNEFGFLDYFSFYQHKIFANSCTAEHKKSGNSELLDEYQTDGFLKHILICINQLFFSSSMLCRSSDSTVGCINQYE